MKRKINLIACICTLILLMGVSTQLDCRIQNNSADYKKNQIKPLVAQIFISLDDMSSTYNLKFKNLLSILNHFYQKSGWLSDSFFISARRNPIRFLSRSKPQETIIKNEGHDIIPHTDTEPQKQHIVSTTFLEDVSSSSEQNKIDIKTISIMEENKTPDQNSSHSPIIKSEETQSDWSNQEANLSSVSKSQMKIIKSAIDFKLPYQVYDPKSKNPFTESEFFEAYMKNKGKSSKNTIVISNIDPNATSTTNLISTPNTSIMPPKLWELDGILKSKGELKAFLNGKLISKGDLIDSYIVIDIKPSYVTLKSPQEQFQTIQLKD